MHGFVGCWKIGRKRESQMIKIELSCCFCGTQLVFPWNYINFLNKGVSDRQWFYECAVKIGYIDCPDCGKRIFLRSDDSGWTSGIKKADGTYLWRKQDNELPRT